MRSRPPIIDGGYADTGETRSLSGTQIRPEVPVPSSHSVVKLHEEYHKHDLQPSSRATQRRSVIQPPKQMSQSRPSGPSYQITDDWLAWARPRVAETGITYTAIAEAAGVTPSAISDIFRGVTKQTRVLPQINAALGGVPPLQIVTIGQLDEIKARIDGAWDDLDHHERELVAQLVDVLTRSRDRR